MTELQEVLTRIWTDLMSRPSGPFAFRFVLQPVMAMIFAVLDGLKDARGGRSPYLWTILTDSEKRANRLREGLKATSRIVALSIVMEVLYQYKVLGTFYIGEALIITFFLALLPYLLMRGPAARLARYWLESRKHK
jgi:hypothetical protein